MKRLSFILSMIAAAACGLAAGFRPTCVAKAAPKPKTWAEHVAEVSSRTHGRRYEHWIHAKVCQGDYDRRMTAAEAAKRRARCAKICGLCRYLYSVPTRSGRLYRRPPKYVLDALENEPYYIEPTT